MSDWKYDVDEVGPEAREDPGIEAGSPDLENAAFVLLGALVTVAFFARMLVVTAGG